jgi:hypothetical protein
LTDGIIYIAYGQRAVAQVERNIQQIHALGEWPIAVISDRPVKGAQSVIFEGDFWGVPTEGQHQGRRIFLPGKVKQHMYKLSPFDRTLYLDTDTRIIKSPKPLFDFLDDWEFAGAIGQGWGGLLRNTQFSPIDLSKTVGLWGSGLLHYINSGVLAWRKCPNCKALFEQWGKEYNAFGGWDEQMALLRALFKVPVLYTMLPTAWNSRLEKGAYIYHPTGAETVWAAEIVPRCTVVIPCYDHETYLGEAVASALQPNTVVIVVDDGSPGNVLYALKHFRNKAVYVLQQENKGLPAARNAGIRASRSKVVMDLDADDKLAPDAVAKMADAWRPRSWVYCDVHLFGDMDVVMRCDVTEASLKSLQPTHPCILYSKEEWALAGGYDETLTAFTTWDFTLRMWERGIRPRKAQVVGVHYRRRKGEGMLVSVMRNKEKNIEALRQRHPDFFGGR